MNSPEEDNFAKNYSVALDFSYLFLVRNSSLIRLSYLSKAKIKRGSNNSTANEVGRHVKASTI